MPQYYVRIEAVNLDYSVYDTHDISTIRGGSFLILNSFNGIKRKAKKAGVQLKILSSAASEAIIRFEANGDNEAFKIEKMCYNALPDTTKKFTTFVSAILPITENQSFQTHIEKLKARCRWQQYKNLSFVLPKPSMKTKDPCSFDGVRPAIYPEGGNEKSSSIVRIRRKNGKKFRNDLYNKLIDKSVFVSEQEDELEPIKKTKFVNDLETLSSNPEMRSLDGKIAFIYIDGNRFGRIRNKLFEVERYLSEDEKLLKDFQDRIQREIREPALETILKFALEPENKSFLTSSKDIRLETLLWGGDEIEWVVPAWQAFNVLKIFFNEASKQQYYSHEKLEKPILLTHAGGVVFCSHNLPILQVRKYAHQLCDIAKSNIPTDVDSIDCTADCFAFLNMTAFDLIKGDVFRFLKEYHFPASPNEFILKAIEIESLEHNLITIKNYFPRNKLFDITTALKNQNFNEINTILEKVYELVPERSVELKNAITDIINGNLHRWFLISDLLSYVGEDK